MIKTATRPDEFLIVLVEDNPHQRNKMNNILKDCFPFSKVKSIAHGIEAMNFLLTPVNKYHLVILDGKLETFPKTFITPVQGPDIAIAMQENNIDVPVILWTNEPAMLNRFDEIYGKRLPEIEKPCRRSNVEVIVRPIIEELLGFKLVDEDRSFRPSP
ncbi:MAG: hypothetical protein H0U70_04040 [Tatlockia sp.]|nr:hypothetical protein [Tatlockia sp.]